jgi:hypothetical protein
MAFKDMLKKPWMWIVVIVILILIVWGLGYIPGVPGLV